MLYNQSIMIISAEVIRGLLALDIVGMAMLAAFFLRQRALTRIEYIGWGSLLLLLPLIGPFLVILLRPGNRVKREESSRAGLK